MYSSFNQCQNQLDGIQSIDYFLARTLCQVLKKEQDELLFHSIMATSQALRNGHTCLKLDAESATDRETLCWHHINENNPEEDKPGYAFAKFSDWHQHLSQITIAPEDNQPLVYECNRLYLRRYWQFEEELGNAIRDLISPSAEQSGTFDRTSEKQVIEQLFSSLSGDESEPLDWQKIAVANALIRQFSIIAGGPGTGKTFTVTKVLAALQALAANQLKIAMIAPTGKAAQRLNESIQKAKCILQSALLDVRQTHPLITDETLNSIPDNASTVHRLLGVIPGCHDFRYNVNRKLPFNVILIDEISMIDLPLMTRLIRAIDQKCRIIMLGDADQLPSVAAGSVLSDLAPRQTPGYSKTSSELLSEMTGFNVPILASESEQANKTSEDILLNLDHLTVLQKSHRFDGSGEIGKLAKYVMNGDEDKSWSCLAKGKEQIERVKDDSFYQWIDRMLEQYYKPLFADNKASDETGRTVLTIEQAFKQLQQFRFIAATRLGEQGVANINDRIEQSLRRKGLITSANEFYPGRPIMVTENHYNIGLYNGDTGLIWKNEEGTLQAAFPENESVRWLSLGRLPRVETVYAITIHKTQGSEFTHVGLVMPEKESLILSRELLYTGITRASKQLSVFATKGIFELGVRRRVLRYSGLSAKVLNSDKAR
ncbi:MAG: exodeoxyribonuclease V subunit alpha [gamma proteobacterium symbiont of Bathyaustriella thionipta]|nr:exodeoxyribonuclease V subunit alpha [gamma proteobacterium symbiont of Bathyaustriella thionipta]MCU7950032.1 exodeoxyribonuclease V subunit alpha [gamma proteobacterium symbiont of Bathyaustriella thionipta]MCU7954232.1 exodeoxyribonuclease V subunit alpha [gamma proteobacterium symbiont of Bathyaustriella thionipta]MCU7956621.1 exodeoxyribonuclease V subunit alpha [gamma proteobacterium symbiont of Bathyaustriella thionipta]MCU7967739.1 exodeoxyribonuclease V subunit alpha [gamma proteoba